MMERGSRCYMLYTFITISCIRTFSNAVVRREHWSNSKDSFLFIWDRTAVFRDLVSMMCLVSMGSSHAQQNPIWRYLKKRLIGILNLTHTTSAEYAWIG